MVNLNMKQFKIALKSKLTKLGFLPSFSICFCLGICLSRYTQIPFLYLYIVALSVLILALVFVESNHFIWPLFVLAVLLGWLFLSNSEVLPYYHIRNFTFYKSEPVIIRGEVTSFPDERKNFSSFTINAKQLTWAGKVYPVAGKVLVKAFGKRSIAYGSRLSLEGKLFRPFTKRNDRFSYADYLWNQGIYSILTISKSKRIENLSSHKLNVFKHFAYKLRNKAKAIFGKYLNPYPAAVLSAMILGERSQLPQHLKREFMQTGTIHILAISGLHVAIIGFILDVFLKIVGIKRRWRYLLIILLLVFYCCLTGARVSVVRATIMASVLLLGFLLKREIKVSYSLSLSALIILTVSPRQLFNLGFELSFLSVIAIVYVAPRIKDLYNQKFNLNKPNKLIWFITSASSTSLAAWLATFGLVAYAFKIISPVAILANIIIVPYLTLVISLGAVLLISALVFPVFTPVFAVVANLSIIILLKVIGLFNSLPGAYYIF